MQKNKVFFEIKSLENLILRYFLNEANEETTEKFIPLTPTQMQIIGYIVENNLQYVYQKDLEQLLNLRRATISGVLQTMEKNELLQRVIDSKDTRIKKVILSEKGRKKYISQKEKIINIEKIITKDISFDDLQTFLNIINKMKENLKDI